MTALAGVIGAPREISLAAACRRALDAQRLYGSGESVIQTAANAALGVSVHHTFSAIPTVAVSPDGRFLVVADIRLDNRADLLRSLGVTEDTGARVETEILALAWSSWGEACLQQLVGDFAIAIYDSQEHSLILARDPTGQRPLFFGRRNGTVHFASMPSGILAGGEILVNPSYLANILAGIGNYGPETAYKSVFKVLPGEIVCLSLRNVTKRFYWQPETCMRRPDNGSALIEAYRSHLDEAVRCRLTDQGDVLATQLSSGYDSAAVAATAARVKSRQQRLVAYTSAPIEDVQASLPRGRIGDESQIAAEVATMHGIEHVVVRNSEPLLSGVRGHSRFYQEPAGIAFNLPWWRQIATDAATAGARVLLTGRLGNYTLNAGGLPVLRDYVRRGEWGQWWREARDVVQRPDVHWRGTLLASFRPWLPERLIDAAEMLFNRSPAPSSFCFLRKHWQGESTPTDSLFSLAACGDFAAERLATIRSEDTGAFAKGGLAQNGIQECDPTSDRRLIEFSLGLPPEELLHRGVYRPLARAALADRLPPSVIDAPLRGYQGSDWFARLRQDDAMATLEEISASPGAMELIDVDKLRRAIEQWPCPDQGFARLAIFGRAVTDAFAVGIFLSEIERYPQSLGV